MELKTYLQTHPGAAKRISSAIGRVTDFINGIATGKHKSRPSLETAALIDRETAGEVPAETIRPDLAPLIEYLRAQGRKRKRHNAKVSRGAEAPEEGAAGATSARPLG